MGVIDHKLLAGICGWLLAICLSINLKAQDSNYTKKKLSQTEVQALFSFYTQDGRHSAVTGGTGTEKLQVYSTQINATKEVNQKNRYYYGIGADVISSASTDRIDFEMSSASSHDLHTSLSFGYERSLKDDQYQLGGELLLSIESDYFSRGGGLWIIYNDPDQTQSLELDFHVFFDDLRWGRLKKPYLIETIRLIYPAELRGIEWFDIYHRHSYNLSLSYRYDLNQRMSLSLYPSFVQQQGLLSTPFHRVYFMESPAPRVEKLPTLRNQGALGVQLNVFTGQRWMLRNFYQFYLDNFGIQSHSLKVESPFKIRPNLAVAPFIRVYHQEASDYFKPFKQHSVSQEFYTSDYDLSEFWSGNIGFNIRLLTGKNLPDQKFSFREFNFRYSHYWREDGLTAHMLGLYVNLQRQREKNLVLK